MTPHNVRVFVKAVSMNVAALLGIGVLTIVPLAAQTARNAAAPFGLGMGQAKGKLGPIVEQIQPYKFLLDSVPKPHPELEMYVATVNTSFLRPKFRPLTY
jgi:hypothetical protein